MIMSRKVVAVLSDLMFTVKIIEAAKHAGLKAVCVRTPADAIAQAAQDCAGIILDLNFAPVELITQLKTGEATRSVPLIGYVSHVQADLIRRAKETGCDQVLARSAFVAHLASMMEALARS
jgi:PleD family two-component response regulator